MVVSSLWQSRKPKIDRRSVLVTVAALPGISSETRSPLYLIVPICPLDWARTIHLCPVAHHLCITFPGFYASNSHLRATHLILRLIPPRERRLILYSIALAEIDYACTHTDLDRLMSSFYFTV